MISATSIMALFNAPNWAELLAEYEAEAAVPGMPPVEARLLTYEVMERGGVLFPYAATDGGTLTGFITVLVAVLPHYSRPVAVSESFFVAKAHRASGAGLGLLAAAETRARDLGSPGLFVSAPFEGRLHELLPKLRYRETNRVFYKAFHDA